MVATIIAVLFSYTMEKKIPLMPTVGAGIILVFGAKTVFFLIYGSFVVSS